MTTMTTTTTTTTDGRGRGAGQPGTRGNSPRRSSRPRRHARRSAIRRPRRQHAWRCRGRAPCCPRAHGVRRWARSPRRRPRAGPCHRIGPAGLRSPTGSGVWAKTLSTRTSMTSARSSAARGTTAGASGTLDLHRATLVLGESPPKRHPLTPPPRRRRRSSRRFSRTGASGVAHDRVDAALQDADVLTAAGAATSVSATVSASSRRAVTGRAQPVAQVARPRRARPPGARGSARPGR